MIKILSMLMVMFMLSSWNDKDIDGKMTVYADFMLVDDDGRHVTITAGTHMTEFSFKPNDDKIELEIKDIDDDDDRDFEFQVPGLSKKDFYKEKLELHFPNTAGDRELDTKMVLTNTLLSKGALMGVFYRCREHSSAVYSYRPVVFYRAKRVTHIAVQISSNEETLALFEATKRSNKQKREIVWTGECGGEMPENLEDVLPN